MPDIAIRSTAPRVFLLDPGPEPFGDCLLVQAGGKTILIDGGHASGFGGQPGTSSIPEQLESILGAPPPFDISLLVVTHCHSDHVGCLPEMMAAGMLRVEWALMADEDAAWSGGGSSLADAIREEPPPDGMAWPLDDAAALRPRYEALLAGLIESGARVTRHGRDATSQLTATFQAAGLEILGPTKAQADLCRAVLRSALADARTYSVEDAARASSAVNCQSIVLAVGAGQHRVLLTGDMQFAAPGVPGVDEEMAALRRRIALAGPFAAAKLPHHGSANGWNAELHAEWGSPELLAISGGHRDPEHPSEAVLRILRSSQDTIRWARTDKNGLVEIRPGSARSPLRVSRGRINDASAGQRRGVTVIARDSASSREIEITARVPDHLRRVVITIESEPREAEPPRREHCAIRLGGGRALPPLLFVSSLERLAGNVGRDAAREAVAAIRAAGHALVDAADPARAIQTVRGHLREGLAGVVLVGGYDVLPAQRLDTLPPDLRSSLEDPDRDADGFIVWSDAAYGDADGSGMPEFPVSRIPDGGSARLLAAALSSGGVESNGRFVLRNAKRPFAEEIAQGIPGSEPTLLSLPSTSATIDGGRARSNLVYLMLHGLATDCSRFFGEEPEYPEAWRAGQVPSGAGVAFCGCCWGALTTRQTAAACRPGQPPDPLPPDESGALAFLLNGANAFAGCTGSHYSPEGGEDGAGAPMHRAFWRFLLSGSAPAEALFRAKLDYIANMPYGAGGAAESAVEHKILHEFTCLGLGW